MMGSARPDLGIHLRQLDARANALAIDHRGAAMLRRLMEILGGEALRRAVAAAVS
jgi:hypothetical protein